eukprot:CAMPEP_0204577032 /NCGR_PEP_ID=MMETSP0661-20131031/42117_1 /ASSEMBLY_ACC=CAM_ASM_000606 /TAXON_ID=109239 /ORGANISM="Alexandrium margalefi, Strain AMGDE01CS-322" /LENGTH=37 /DNA_ID= /DNA_START= /DNA_END= /DNA_ORIENTATION=
MNAGDMEQGEVLGSADTDLRAPYSPAMQLFKRDASLP